jgi:hypothetical protein
MKRDPHGESSTAVPRTTVIIVAGAAQAGKRINDLERGQSSHTESV